MNYFFLFIITFSTAINAESISDRIYQIHDGLIKFENGRVAFYEKKHYQLKNHDFIKAEIDENSNVTSIIKLKEMDSASFKSLLDQNETLSEESFEPTIVPSLSEAENIFRRFNPYYKRISECSDRAHVWAHDEFKFSGTKSMKAFIFFTASYINSVRFKWWFHVAPMYQVNNQGEIQNMVMDYRYTDRPLTVKEWTDKFVYTKRPCKITTRFSEYDVNPQTENCYLIFENMHYKIPAEINEKEMSGKMKTKTTDNELKASYRYAFQPKKQSDLE